MRSINKRNWITVLEIIKIINESTANSIFKQILFYLKRKNILIFNMEEQF